MNRKIMTLVSVGGAVLAAGAAGSSLSNAQSQSVSVKDLKLVSDTDSVTRPQADLVQWNYNWRGRYNYNYNYAYNYRYNYNYNYRYNYNYNYNYRYNYRYNYNYNWRYNYRW